MFRFTRWAVIAISALAVMGCATMSVSSHVQRGIDFAQYRTYDWGPVDALPTGDSRLDNDPYFRDRVQGAVEKQLAARGFKGPTAETPDLLIHYHASIDQRIDVVSVDRERGYGGGDDWQGRIIEYEAGTLVVDIIDARTNRVIWRGWAQDSVDDALDDQTRMEKKINEAVTRMFERLPRGLVGDN